jgi:hypothetical protein
MNSGRLGSSCASRLIRDPNGQVHLSLEPARPERVFASVPESNKPCNAVTVPTVSVLQDFREHLSQVIGLFDLVTMKKIRISRPRVDWPISLHGLRAIRATCCTVFGQ